MTVLLSVAEQAQLQKLADDEGTPATQLIRALVKRAYVRRFGEEKPHPTPATLRGLLDDLRGRAHYTAHNIAERMGVQPKIVLDSLERLHKASLVTKVENWPNGDSTWEVNRAPEVVDTIVARKRIDLDEPLVGEED